MSLNILPIVRKEFRQIKRDKRVLAVMLFIPALMLFLFGYALNFDIKHTATAVYDEDKSRMSRDFIDQFFRNEYFDYTLRLQSKSEINGILDGGLVKVVLVIPSDFSEHLANGKEAAVQVIIDGSNSNTGSMLLGYINMIIQQYSVNITEETYIAHGNHVLAIPIDYQPRVWYNPELKSAKFLVPGLIAFILMVTAVISTALAVVREREMGTIEQIMVSPVKPLQLILGKTIPYTVISLAATVMILGTRVHSFRCQHQRKRFTPCAGDDRVSRRRTRHGIADLDDCGHTAGGVYDCGSCNHAANIYSFRFCLSDSQYAVDHSNHNVSDSSPLFSGCTARYCS